MSIDPIDIGTPPWGDDGDTNRAAFTKVNANEADLDSRAVPAGGATGQLLAKLSATDHHVGWGDPEQLSVPAVLEGKTLLGYRETVVRHTAPTSPLTLDLADGNIHVIEDVGANLTVNFTAPVGAIGDASSTFLTVIVQASAYAVTFADASAQVPAPSGEAWDRYVFHGVRLGGDDYWWPSRSEGLPGEEPTPPPGATDYLIQAHPATAVTSHGQQFGWGFTVGAKPITLVGVLWPAQQNETEVVRIWRVSDQQLVHSESIAMATGDWAGWGTPASYKAFGPVELAAGAQYRVTRRRSDGAVRSILNATYDGNPQDWTFSNLITEDALPYFMDGDGYPTSTTGGLRILDFLAEYEE
jgi:hypothetical protein